MAEIVGAADPGRPRLVVIGGGAAGFFAAIACAEHTGDGAEVLILERGREVLGKVKISGGGRCNVTHDLDDPRALAEFYPRGAKSLIGPLSRWRQSDTVAWFSEHGVELKSEEDGRMFPVTNRSETVVDCLLGATRELGIRVHTHAGVAHLSPVDGGFEVVLEGGEVITADAVLVATGGIRNGSARAPAESAGQAFEAPVPSLFTFKIADPSLTELAGVSVPSARLSVAGSKLRSEGPLLVTHWGLSGPAVLKLSAWGARDLQKGNYQFELIVDWLGGSWATDEVRGRFDEWRRNHGARQVAKRSPFEALPKRLWARFVEMAGIERSATWATLAKTERSVLLGLLTSERLQVAGKSLNKDEFVTCGGVPLRDVDLKTMESRRVPGMYFAGEVLDIDGLTGGFNFQSAWTTGRIAGESIAARLSV